MPLQKGRILAQHSARTGRLPQLLFAVLLLVLPALTVVTAFGIAPGTAVDDVTQTLVREAVPLPDFASPSQAPQHYVAQERVLRGDTVAALFERLGAHDSKALEFLRADATGR